jgi:hypothetical protein
VEQFRRNRFGFHSSILSLCGAGCENTGNRSRNHQIFVRWNDANRGPAGVGRNHSRSFGIARLAQGDAEEAQSLTNARADEGRIFADTSSEHKRIQASEGSGEGANPLLSLITEQSHGFRRPDIVGFLRQLVSETPSKPDLWLTISAKLLVVICSVRARKGNRLGSRSPERVLITNPAVGVKLMLVSMLLPSRTAAMLAPLPR